MLINASYKNLNSEIYETTFIYQNIKYTLEYLINKIYPNLNKNVKANIYLESIDTWISCNNEKLINYFIGSLINSKEIESIKILFIEN